MQIAFYNFKGGMGKTSLSTIIAKEMNAGLVVNDPYLPIEDRIDAKKYIKVGPGEPYPDIPNHWSIVYDLGGWIDSRLNTLFKTLDWILIPIIHEKLDNDALKVTISTIEEIKTINKNIIIVVNKEQTAKTKAILERLYDFPVFTIRKSNSIPKAKESYLPLGDLIETQIGAPRKYYVAVAEQIKEILSFMKIKESR